MSSTYSREREYRSTWKFPFGITDVRDAANVKASYHREREEYWALDVTEAEKELREKGVDLREFEATGGKQFQAVIDPARAQRLSEAKAKRDSHKAKAEQYEGFVAGLAKLQGEAGVANNGTLELTIDDIAHFGLDAAK
jgi:hypothetical protein